MNAADDARGAWGQFIDQLRSRGPGHARYDYQGKIAQGGMGVIHRVFDRDARRPLALKLMIPLDDERPPADDASLGRFLEEAQVTSQLDHPGIVPVHEIGVDERDRVYFTMKLVKGEDLRAIFDRVVDPTDDEWTTTRALNVMLRVCEAMAYAHDKGVIHRDLKPGNVMVGRFGEAYVMDWGLAKVVGREDCHDLRPQVADTSILRSDREEAAAATPDSPIVTMDGSVLGTPAYMPPEQAAGRVDELGPPADVYAVGAMLYHLLSTRMPYVPAGAPLSPRTILAAVTHGPPPSLSTVAPDAPAELVAIVERAMAREVADRYPDMTALARDLRAYLEQRVVSAYETGAWAELRKWVQRNKALAMTAAAAMVSVVAFAGWALLSEREAARAKADADRKATESIEAQGLAERKSYSAFVHAATIGLDAGRVEEARRLLSLCPEGLRNWEWGHIGLGIDPSLQTIQGHAASITSVSWSPDGARVVSGSHDDTLRIWDVSSGETAGLLLGHDDAVNSVAWSPDGSEVISGSDDGHLRIWDATTSECRLIRSHGSSVLCVAWSPDGTRIVSASRDHTLRIWDAASATTLRTFAGQEDPVIRLAWSPDGRRIVSTSGGESACIWDAENGETRILLVPDDDVVSAAWSPGGSRIVTGTSRSGTLQVWDAETGERTLTMDGHGPYVSAPSVRWSPDGDRIASGGHDDVVIIWDAATGERLQSLIGHGASVLSVAWSPDSTRIISGGADRTLRVWHAGTSDSVHALRLGEPTEAMALSPDGRQIASWSRDNTLRVWDASNGESPQVLRETEEIRHLAWSPDGSRIASCASDQFVQIRDVVSGEVVRTLEMPRRTDEDAVTSLAWSPDSHSIVIGSEHGILSIWDVADRRPPKTLAVTHEFAVQTLAWSPDGTRIVSGSLDATSRIWDASAGECLRVLRGHSGAVEAVAWSADGTRVASGSEDGTARIWSASRGECLHVLRGHGKYVSSVAWSPDGTRVVSGGIDGQLRVWDPADGDCVLTLASGHGGVSAVAWSPDGTRIVALAQVLLIFESRLEEARTFWRAEDRRRRVRPLVDALFDELIMMAPVCAAIESDPTLTAEARRSAIRVAEARGNPSAVELHSLAWSLVDPDRPDADSDVALGLRLALLAVDGTSKDWRYSHLACDSQGTLAWALFANGRHDEAIAAAQIAGRLAPPERTAEFEDALVRLQEMVERE